MEPWWTRRPDAFRTISEVADDLDVPQHVLRFWETRFHADQADEARRRPALLPARRHRSAARHPPSALRRGLHDPRRAAHPEGSRHQVRAERLAAGRAAALARRRRESSPNIAEAPPLRPQPGERGGAAMPTPRIGDCSACCHRSSAAGRTKNVWRKAAASTTRHMILPSPLDPASARPAAPALPPEKACAS